MDFTKKNKKYSAFQWIGSGLLFFLVQLTLLLFKILIGFSALSIGLFDIMAGGLVFESIISRIAFYDPAWRWGVAIMFGSVFFAPQMLMWSKIEEELGENITVGLVFEIVLRGTVNGKPFRSSELSILRLIWFVDTILDVASAPIFFSPAAASLAFAEYGLFTDILVWGSFALGTLAIFIATGMGEAVFQIMIPWMLSDDTLNFSVDSGKVSSGANLRPASSLSQPQSTAKYTPSYRPGGNNPYNGGAKKSEPSFTPRSRAEPTYTSLGSDD